MNLRLIHRLQVGFTLVELLVTLFAGAVLVGVIAEALLVETGASRQLGRLLRERVVAKRALALISSEIQQSQRITLTSSSQDHPDCGLSGRAIKLHLLVPEGKVTYSIESKPHQIWRGQALMRCGPVYGSEGFRSDGTNASRVLVDSLDGDGLQIIPIDNGISVTLLRKFVDERGRVQSQELGQDVYTSLQLEQGSGSSQL